MTPDRWEVKAVEPGMRFGPYEVLDLLGRGGMGDVWRARDTTLRRDVALKTLPDALAQDPTRLARLRKEAQVLASLNNPYIGTIYGFEEAGPTPALVLELVQGQTLATRLSRGPLPVNDALRIAGQIAEALEAAHEHGIVHRDLKPGNVMLRPDGTVKVLDFGLATLGPEHTDAAATTLTLTQPGTVAGTPAYMAPEQARGETIDHRADIWAFGCVLYEMLTGRTAFGAPTVAESLAKVLEGRVDLDALPAETPSPIRRLVRRCLDRSLRDRLQHIGDARADIADVRTGELSAGAAHELSRSKPPAPSLIRTRRSRQGTVATGVVALAIAAAMWTLSRPASPEGDPFTLQDPEQLTFTGNARLPAISPDARSVAFVQKGERGDSLRVLQTTNNTVDDERVEAQDGVKIVAVTFSPDGDFVYFVTRKHSSFALRRVSFVGSDKPRPIRDNVRSAIAFEPGGSRFAFVTTTKGRWSLMLSNAGGSTDLEEKEIAWRTYEDHGSVFLSEVHPEGTNTGTGPAWSFDAATIAIPGTGYEKNIRTGYTMFVRVSDGNVDARPMTPSGPGGEWFDDATIFWNRPLEAEGPAHLWSLSYPFARLGKRTGDLSNYGRISFTKDRDALVTTRANTDSEIQIGDGAWKEKPSIVDTSAARPLVSSLAAQVAWAGHRLLFAGLSRDGVGLWEVRPGEKKPVELKRSAHSPAATADGEEIAYLSQPGYSLYRADSEGRNATPLAPDAYWPVMTPAGDVVYADSTKGQTLWSVAPGKSPHRITDMGARNQDVSPDGRYVAFLSAEHRQDVIMICERRDCTPHALTGVPGLSSGASPIRWTSNGQSIAYINALDGSNIWLQPINGSKAVPLTSFTDGKRIVSFAWSRDFARLAILREKRSTDIILFKGIKTRTGPTK